jgi:ABC-2 type transport system permease protein
MGTATGAVLPERRSGVAHWLQAYRAMLRWEVTSFRLLLPLMVITQFLLGAGFVLGIGLFFSEIPQRSALYLTTGAAVVALVGAGLVLEPQLIADQKQRGTYDFMWSLPVPRSAATAAWVTLSMVIAVPGLLGAVLVGMWRFDLDLSIGWDVVPAITLSLLAATMIGYALAHTIPKPEVTVMVSQLLIFVLVGFAPINFPPENLPAWLAEVHQYLPFAPMAAVVRAALADGLATDVARSYVVLGAWTVFATALAAAALRVRR